MPRTSQNSRTPNSSTRPTSLEKEKKQDEIAESAFGDLLALYDNEDDITNAWMAARRKVKTLREEETRIKRTTDMILLRLNNACDELDDLADITSKDTSIAFEETNDQSATTRTLSESISAIRKSVQNSCATQDLAKQSTKNKKEIAQANVLVNMLLHAKNIARASGMKRSRVEEPEAEISEEDESSSPSKRLKLEANDDEDGLPIIRISTTPPRSPATLSAGE